MANHLLAQGHKVIGVDNGGPFSWSYALVNSRTCQLQKHNSFHLEPTDIRQYEKLEVLFSEYEIDAVLHFAALAGVRRSIQIPQEYCNVNIMGTLNLLELCRRYKIYNFLFASSSSIYGTAAEGCPSQELDLMHPISVYAASKCAAEHLCYSYHYLHGINTAILRYFTVYGPAGRPDMAILKFIYKAMKDEAIEIYGNGLQERDFTYIDDVVRATYRAINLGRACTLNVGSGRTVTIRYLVELISRLTEAKCVKAKYSPADKSDAHRTFADIQRAKTILNWEPKIKLEDGVKQTVDWSVGNEKLLEEIYNGETNG